MYIYAIDGRYVVPVRVDAVTIANGNRYSIMVKLDKPAGDYTVRIANAGINQLISGNVSLSYNTPFKAQSRPSQPSIDITGANTTADVVIFDESMVIPFPVEVPAQQVAQTSS
jgi:FtsP/CotA-like multicopper oxidase with cupredoxin domain